MTDYDVNEHAEYIFENQLDDFFNWLAIDHGLSDVLWCAFDVQKFDKLAAMAGHIVRANKWRQYMFDLLDAGNVVMWDYLREYAQELHDEYEEAFAANQAEQAGWD